MEFGIFIAIYLFAAGAGAGAFLTAITADLYAREGFRSLIRAGTLISGPMVGLGMPFLILDLGAGKTEPWRIINLFFGNPGSIMSIGAWIISAFVGVAMLCATFEFELPWFPWPWAFLKKYRMRFMILGAVLAFATAVYTGLLLGVVGGIPLWNTTVLPALFFVSALSTGMAASVVFAVIQPHEERPLLAHHFFYLNQVHSLMIVVEIIFIIFWLFLISRSSETGAASVAMMTNGELSFWFWTGVIFFGIVDPLLIYIYEVVLRRPLMAYAMIISDGSVLVGGFVLRYLVLAAALPIDMI